MDLLLGLDDDDVFEYSLVLRLSSSNIDARYFGEDLTMVMKSCSVMTLKLLLECKVTLESLSTFIFVNSVLIGFVVWVVSKGYVRGSLKQHQRLAIT